MSNLYRWGDLFGWDIDHDDFREPKDVWNAPGVEVFDVYDNHNMISRLKNSTAEIVVLHMYVGFVSLTRACFMTAQFTTNALTMHEQPPTGIASTTPPGMFLDLPAARHIFHLRVFFATPAPIPSISTLRIFQSTFSPVQGVFPVSRKIQNRWLDLSAELRVCCVCACVCVCAAVVQSATGGGCGHYHSAIEGNFHDSGCR